MSTKLHLQLIWRANKRKLSYGNTGEKALTTVFQICSQYIVGDDTWHEREEFLCKCINSIIPCDIFSDNPLLDIVNTNLCLQCACTMYAEYKEGVKKLTKNLGAFR